MISSAQAAASAETCHRSPPSYSGHHDPFVSTPTSVAEGGVESTDDGGSNPQSYTHFGLVSPPEGATFFSSGDVASSSAFRADSSEELGLTSGGTSDHPLTTNDAPRSPSPQSHHVDPTCSSHRPKTDIATKLSTRQRSATHVMAFHKNQDPNARSGSTGATLSSPTSPDPSSSNRSRSSLFTVGSVQIKSTSVVDVIAKASSDPSTQALLEAVYQIPYNEALSPAPALTVAPGDAQPPTKPKRKNPPTSLPPELKLPMALRCDFCQKFDSVCSQCHFKWRGIAESRKAVFTSNFQALSEHRRLPLLFLTVAYGHFAAITAVIDALTGGHNTTAISSSARLRLSEWQAPFVPVALPHQQSHDDLTAIADRFRKAGSMSLLHVACGMQRLDVSKYLLERGAKFRRSQHRLSPLDLLPSPLPDDWCEMLSVIPAYEEFTMVERARRLRTECDYEGALLEYQAAIQRNPSSESARCGIAKTMFDQGDLGECIRLCDTILRDASDIQWLELTPECVVLLKDEAQRALHERAHADHSTALRACGCVIISEAHHRISIRRLKFRLILDRVLPYCTCSDLWALWRSSRMPLLQIATERLASKGSLETVALMLTNEFGYAEMYEAIRADQPPTDGPHAVLKAPLRFLGVQVAVMADFHTFLMKASVVGANPKYSPDSFFSFGKKSEESKRARIVATKCFRVYRAGVGKAWEVGDGGEWEIDLPASDALLNAVQERLGKR